MKRIIALLLIFCFALTMCLAGCEEDKPKKSSDDDTVESSKSAESSEVIGSESSESNENSVTDGGIENEEPASKDEVSNNIGSESSNEISDVVSDETSDVTSSDESSVPDEPSLPSDGFLNETKYWDETVNILGYNGEYSYHSIQIDTEEMTEEPLNDAFFKRNFTIKRQYGIDIELALPAMGEDPISMLREDMVSGLNEYQAIVVPIVYIAPFAVEGLLLDFNSVDNNYLHLDQPWWDQGLINDLSINNKVYFLAGDALVEDDEATWAMYFNKDLVLTYAIEEDLYQLVRDGEWTFDKMYEIAQMVNKNTSGGNKTYYNSLHIGGDQWGMVAQSYDFYLFMQGAEQTVVDNSGNVPVLRILDGENVSTFNKITEFFYDDENVGVADYHGRWDEGIYDQEKQIFAVGNSLFMPNAVWTLNQDVMKESSANIGIIPMPKVDEAQERYGSAVTVYHFPVIAIPEKNESKFDVTCYALEAMAFYGSKLVTPEYYQSIYDSVPLADEENSDILDMIFDNRIYDVGVSYALGDESSSFLYCYNEFLGYKTSDIVKRFEIRIPVYQIELDMFMEDFAD